VSVLDPYRLWHRSENYLKHIYLVSKIQPLDISRKQGAKQRGRLVYGHGHMWDTS
jgi:hypothetical protein